MHEVGLMQSVLTMSIKAAEAHRAPRIDAIHLRIGALAGVVPDALQFAFECLRKGTLAESAQLKIESVPILCWCRKCKSDFRPENQFTPCPKCGLNDFEIRGGLEMNLVSLEIPDHDHV